MTLFIYKKDYYRFTFKKSIPAPLIIHREVLKIFVNPPLHKIGISESINKPEKQPLNPIVTNLNSFIFVVFSNSSFNSKE